MLEGEFVNDKINGKATEYYEDGTYFIGQWKDNLKHGKGKLYGKNGKVIEEQNYNEDELE